MMFTMSKQSRILFILTLILFSIGISIGSPEYQVTERGVQQPLGRIADEDQTPLHPNPHAITALLDALDVLQDDYFAVWAGIWPKAIDWTSAVIGTYVAAGLSTLSKSFESLSSDKASENLVDKYFSQVVASYFGQDAFSLRQQAFDDMLWVVLGWLEGIKFINEHSARHYSSDLKSEKGNWYGRQWIPAFAHRARLFWELASRGWDTSLCSGGMIWSPYLTPYKNAITNELYIAASISMYLYFPGDDNTSPFELTGPNAYSSTLKTAMEKEAPAHDPKYLAAAIEAYKWLKDSNMTDSQGLFVDGFHISGWNPDRSKNDNTRCDARNEMVYTYNQGVLLTGQRGLYEATGAKSYLEDGHRLISDVVAATGWDLIHDCILDKDAERDENQLGKWHGLGRSGVLEEACDAQAYCSQNGQTFKGIFMHHLTAFCQHLPEHLVLPGNLFSVTGGVSYVEEVRKWHDGECKRYKGWIKHNAHAAVTTRDGKGRFGMWWGAPAHSGSQPDFRVELPDEAVDYRNQGVPREWKDRGRSEREFMDGNGNFEEEGSDVGAWDLNDRGRGRTVETQGGGVSILRAMWELVDMRP